MITFSKVRSSFIEKGKRVLKVFEFGAKTAVEIAPFGDDSNPIANMTAIYADTGEAGDKIILGYINQSQLAEVGEKRIYSTDSNGAIKFFIWLKNDGTCQIGGTDDNMVRYEKLDDALQAQKTDINVELAKIQSGIIAAGGSYAKLDISINTSAAKINEIKTL